MVYNGRFEYLSGLDQGFKWLKRPIKNSNELYVELDGSSSHEMKVKAAKKFFDGSLKPSDVPQAEFAGEWPFRLNVKDHPDQDL